jgi:2-methylisocitrate lyase-like PEP mutase family enzyme
MSVRKKLREIMGGKRLVLMPGAYDGLSARIMEAEGFEAICAGGYAAIGSMLAQADMGQSNMRDYADHYARICGAVDLPVYVDADTGFGEVNNVRQMIRAFEAAGVAGVFISDQVLPRVPMPPASKVSMPRSNALSFSWRPAPTWRNPWGSMPSTTSNALSARSKGRIWRRFRKRLD